MWSRQTVVNAGPPGALVKTTLCGSHPFPLNPISGKWSPALVFDFFFKLRYNLPTIKCTNLKCSLSFDNQDIEHFHYLVSLCHQFLSL